MHNSDRAYHEGLLHWIWQNNYIEYNHLYTNRGKKVIIHNPGSLNKTDGPDFSGAEITIGKLRWYGNVEIHWQLSDWKHHQHQKDANFDNVILHIVFENTEQVIQRMDGSTIPTLCLAPFISKPLRSFVSQYRSHPQLPCAGQLSFISEEAFLRQLEKAHEEYFEQKVDDLLEFYDSDLPPSMAWKKMLTIALFDGLGISHNRLPMQKLAIKLFPVKGNVKDATELRQQAIRRSGIESPTNAISGFNWKHKGCRPGNHPFPRIGQGAYILWYIHALPFEHWGRKDPKLLWKNMKESISISPSLGEERSSILFGTVFLPALYFLGNLLYSEQLKNRSWRLWKNHQASLPKSLLQLLHDTSLPASIYAQKLGAVYQLRNYCRPRRCQNCEVFKSAISS